MDVRINQNSKNGNIIIGFIQPPLATTVEIEAKDLDKFHELIKEAKLKKDEIVHPIVIPRPVLVTH